MYWIAASDSGRTGAGDATLVLAEVSKALPTVAATNQRFNLLGVMTGASV